MEWMTDAVVRVLVSPVVLLVALLVGRRLLDELAGR